jgi:hypothetical protein
VDGDEAYVIRDRENVSDLFAGERTLP